MPPFSRRSSRSKKRRLEEDEDPLADRISRLPDDVLGEIVSLLPTKDGVRTQVLSSRWRHIWRSVPLNLELFDGEPDGGRGIYASDISSILAAHAGPGRRFVLPRRYVDHPTAAMLDVWLWYAALDNLQELDFRHVSAPPVPLPAAVRRFSSTLRVASFSRCIFPPADANSNSGSALRLPVLQQMTISNADISESSLHAMLAGCPVLQSLLLSGNNVSSRLQIVSPSLRSIGLHCSLKSHSFALVIEDAPCLERLQYFGRMQVDISVISAPRLVTLANLFDNYRSVRSGTTIFQGSTVARMTTMLPSVKDLSLSNVNICADAAINLVRCFPQLERLYIKAKKGVLSEDAWYHENQKLKNLDIRIRKIMLTNYKGNESQIDFVNFFLSNARVLESLTLELGIEDAGDVWIARRHKLLYIKKRASRGARVDILPPNNKLVGPPDLPRAEQVHDLSADPFQRFHD